MSNHKKAIRAIKKKLKAIEDELTALIDVMYEDDDVSADYLHEIVSAKESGVQSAIFHLDWGMSEFGGYGDGRPQKLG